MSYLFPTNPFFLSLLNDDIFKGNNHQPLYFNFKTETIRSNLDLTENKDGSLSFSLDLPGYDKKEIAVSLSEGIVKIAAKNEKRGEYKLGVKVGEIDEKSLRAKFSNGELTISFREKTEEAKEKSVEVD